MSRSRSRRRTAAAQAATQRKRRKYMLYAGLGGAGLVLVAIVFAALLSGNGSTGNPAAEDVGLAKDFSFTLYQGEQELAGEKLNLAELRGKPVVLNFWAGLCPPCRAEMPDLQRFYEETQDEVVMLGIDVGRFNNLGGRRDAQKLLQELGITYPAGFTRDGSVMREYEVLSMPTTVFINSKGEVFHNWSGVITRDILVSLTDSMANAEARSEARSES